ncbi:MAG TPA: hypothetical protein VES94_02500 [Burkholderiales bacterium]|nr:hypothetical protein [Burkholderiales bacterium]
MPASRQRAWGAMVLMIAAATAVAAATATIRPFSSGDSAKPESGEEQRV